MNSLVDLKQKLATTDPATVVSILGLSLTAADLQSALGVTYAPPAVAWFDVVTNGSLHLRSTPYIDPNAPQANILENMPEGTIVGVLDGGTAIIAVGYNWLHVQSPTGRLGYAVNAVGGVATLVPKPVAPPSGWATVGLHMLQDAEFATIKDAGILPASVTVINRIDTANAFYNYGVKYVLYRSVPGPNGDSVTVPDDPTQAEAYGAQIVNDRWAQFAGLNTNVYVQITNEIPYSVGHNAFWKGVMIACQQKGYRAAIGCYGVGHAEPSEWQAMTEALTMAKQNGHIVCLHAYTKVGSVPGGLSPATDQPYYELRFPRLYNAVPVTAWPQLVIGEFGTSEAVFQGSAALVSLVKAYRTAVAGYPYLRSFNIWTVGGTGGWSQSDITTALQALKVSL